MRGLTVVALSASAILVACGGGGGGDSSPGPLAKYAGNYSYCQGHERGSLSAVASADGTALTLSVKSDYYQETNCAGALVGTEVYSTSITATYQSTGASTVSGYPIGGGPSQQTVDRVSITAPAGTISLTGSGVTTVNGQRCIVYTNGRSCPDSLTTTAISATGGLAFASNALLVLAATNAGYELDTAYQR